MNDQQTWAVLLLLATTILGLFAEMRSERKEMRSALAAIKDAIGELKVTVARIDERLKGLEVR